jgi:proteasome lid subunit RPN8/RPN11
LKALTIIGGKKPIIEDRPPPPNDHTTAHKWLLGQDPKKPPAHESDVKPLYISKIAEEKMRNHATSKLNERLEVMGLMLGQAFNHEGVEYTVVRDVATTDLDASSTRVRFRRDGFEKLFASMDDIGFDHIVTGWYHSHPGHGIFMSPTDVDTQKSMFSSSFHRAVVIDPVNKEIGAYRMGKVDVEPVPFVIYWEEYQNPYYGTSVRKRTLID